VTERFEALKLLDGAAVHPFGLGLIAEEKSERGRDFEEALEAFGEEVVAVLGFDDSIVIVHEVGAGADQGPAVCGDCLIAANGKHAAMQAFHAKESLLGESDALDGEELPGVYWLIGGDGLFPKMGNLVDLFETYDGEGGGGERVLAGVLGGAGFALRGARSGGEGGIGAVGGELLFGDGFPGTRHGSFRFEG